MESEEFKALVTLLDDDDDQIVNQAREKILSLGTSIIVELVFLPSASR